MHAEVGNKIVTYTLYKNQLRMDQGAKPMN